MAQLVAVGLLGVLLTVAAIVWRNRLPQTGKGRSRYPSLGSIGDMLRMAGGRSLPVEGFEDWKLHYLRIAISALPSQRRLAIASGVSSMPAQAGSRRGLEHADAG